MYKMIIFRFFSLVLTIFVVLSAAGCSESGGTSDLTNRAENKNTTSNLANTTVSGNYVSDTTDESTTLSERTLLTTEITQKNDKPTNTTTTEDKTNTTKDKIQNSTTTEDKTNTTKDKIQNSTTTEDKVAITKDKTQNSTATEDKTNTTKDKTQNSTTGKRSTTMQTMLNESLVSADKPTVENTAHLINPMKSTVNVEADMLWDKVMSANCEMPIVNGQVWYVSNNGNDNNDGKTPGTAVATFSALKYRCKPKAGDAILLECGSVWHGTLTLSSDIFLGSYGSGDKPAIYGSAMNYATAKWTRQGQKNVWRAESVITADIGNVIFNHGEKAGLKKGAITDLKNELDFYYDGAYVYVFSDQDPSTRFESIEIGTKNHIILLPANAKNVTIDNITIKYGGAHGIAVLDNSQNITIRNCEIGWIGGSYLSGNTPFGNGIEFWNGCEDVLVENNWIYQIFDTGISHQGNSKHIAKNILFQNNLIEYCDYASIEYWHHPATQNEMINVTYTKNIMRFAGFGWGSFRRASDAPHIRSNSGMDNKATNFVISDNIMEHSAGSLVYSLSNANTLPKLKGNRYIQVVDRGLCIYGGPTIKVRNESYAKKAMQEIMMDETGVFELYPY